MQTIALILTGVILGLVLRYLVQRLADKHAAQLSASMPSSTDLEALEAIINDIKQANRG